MTWPVLQAVYADVQSLFIGIMRIVRPLNHGWSFQPHADPADVSKAATDEWQIVHLPHTNKELPLTYFDEKECQFVSMYKHRLDVGKVHRSQRALLHFEGVMTACKVYVNGNLVTDHVGGYTGFDAYVTPYLRYDGLDEVTVVVDSRELTGVPPFGGQIDYLTYGGIYREVQLLLIDSVYISHVFAKPYRSLDVKKALAVDVTIKTSDGWTGDANVHVQLVDGEAIVAEKTEMVQLGGEAETLCVVDFSALENIQLWDLDMPKLYTVKVTVNEDEVATRVGFRTCAFTPKGFVLNGRKVQIIGLNRHQSFPYVGYAMPARVQRKDADILKEELGLNLVRTSHYPQSRHFLDRCDEIGLLVFTEIPGWQHIGDEAWQGVAIDNVRDMILRDCNHPSIVLWGVRINESPDHHDFYTKTNALARKLDPTRQTGGVRCIEGSELLEDVYTMNDFALDGATMTSLGGRIPLRGQQDVTKLDKKVPYLVTEYIGHMFPTKKADPEGHQQEHAYRHLMVVDAGHTDGDVCGTIGWCAFDYNTHKDFGSGDRICHHGVMDMFRLPKLAAYAYRSQKSPHADVVLKPATFWTRGDRPEGMEVSPILVMTNCDKVDVTIGGKPYGTYYPSRAQFKGLPYPPVVIDKIEGEWGMSWVDAEFIGYSMGEEVARQPFAAGPLFVDLALKPDSACLELGETWDATRIIVSSRDQHGHPLMFHDTIVQIEVTGAAELIGPSMVVLKGGTSAFWIRTKGVVGNAAVAVTAQDGKRQQVTVAVIECEPK